MDSTSYRTTHFPPQKKVKKTKTWYKDCIDAAEELIYTNDEYIRQSWANKRANYDLANDILDEDDVRRITNPYKLASPTLPAKMQNYPILMPKLDILIGEEMRRRFEFFVRITNEDAISQKEVTLKEEANRVFINAITQQNLDRRDFESAMQRLQRFQNYEYQDLRERRATQLLKYLSKKLSIKRTFSDCFQDLLISSEEIACVDIIAGEPVLRKVNPMNITAISNGKSCFIEDADIIIEEDWYPRGKIIDMFYDELTDSEVKRIMDGNLSKAGGRFNLGKKEMEIIPTSMFEITMDPDTGYLKNDIDVGADSSDSRHRGAYDLDGNIKLTRIVWRGLKCVWKIKYFDQETQSMEEMLMPYDYEPSPEEDAKKIWINEWYEGSKIGSGKDCIHVKYGPRPIQFRELDNPSKCQSGYVGTYMNINDRRAYSLMDRGKPFQYLYNVYMYRTEQAFAKSYGKVFKLPLHLVPDDWDLDEWLNYMMQMGIMITDPFKEGDRGAAQGKLAGSYADNNLVADLEMGNYIQQHISMLEYIKQQLSEITGVNDARQGEINDRELVGNVQRSVAQSAVATQKWYETHDDFKRRALTLLLETAKYAYKGKKKKLQMIMDDMTSAIFDIDGDELMESDFGIFVSNSTSDTQMYEDLRILSQSMMQNDKITFGQIVDLYTSDSIASTRRKIEAAEQNKMEREERIQRDQIEAQQQAVQAQSQLEQAKMALEERNNLRDNQTKLLIEELKLRADAIQENGEDDSGLVSFEMKKHKDQLQLDKEKIDKDVAEKEEERKLKLLMHKDKMKREDKKITKMGQNKTSK